LIAALGQRISAVVVRKEVVNVSSLITFLMQIKLLRLDRISNQIVRVSNIVGRAVRPDRVDIVVLRKLRRYMIDNPTVIADCKVTYPPTAKTTMRLD
jgi:hypothetical protein